MLFLLSLLGKPILNEVMSNPAGKTGSSYPEDRNEFIELYNPREDTLDISGWIIDDLDAWDEILPWKDSAILDFHPGVKINTTKIPPKSYALIMDPEYLSTDPDKLYEQPYDIPSNTIILTIDNTSLGNGLASTDPLLLVSPDKKDTVTFGTPFIEDNFPYDTEDGISWERIEPLLPDSFKNWSPCLSPAGNTAGRENSTLSYVDGKIDAIKVSPDIGSPNKVTIIEVWVMNNSFISVECSLQLDIKEYKTFSSSLALLPKELKNLKFQWTPEEEGTYLIRAILSIPKDKNLLNDTLSLSYIVLGKKFITVTPHIITDTQKVVTISYVIPDEGKLSLTLFDFGGRRVKPFLKKVQVKDSQTIKWDFISDKNKFKTGIYLLLYELITPQKKYISKLPLYVVK